MDQPAAHYSYPETVIKDMNKVNISNVMGAGLALVGGAGASLSFATKADLSKGTFSNANEVEPVTSSYPPAAPTSHVVKQTGETCMTIARMYFHDESLAAMIAAVNLVQPNQPLGVMEQIRLPQFIASAKRADTSMAYQQFAECLRQQLPFLPMASIEHHTSFIKQIVPILAVAIAVVVAPYLAGAVLGITTSAAAASAVGLAGGAATGVGAVATATVAEAAIAGLVNASLQGVAIMGHLQDKFSYGQVFSAAGGAAMRGIGTAGATSELGAAAVEATKAAAYNIGQQLTQLAAGEIPKFDAMSVAKDVGVTLATLGVNKSAFGESLVEEHPLIPGGFIKQQAHQYMHQATGVATNAAAEVVQKGRLNVNQLAQNAIGSAVGMHAGQVAGLGADSLTHHYYDKDRGAAHNVKPVQGVQRKQQQQAQHASSSRAREDVWVDLSDVMGDAKYHAGEPSYNGMFGRGHGTLGVSELHNQHLANPGLDISDASYQLSELNHKRMGQARQASPIATWSRDTAGLSVHDKVIYGAYLSASYYTGITQSVAHEALQTVHHIGSSIVNGVTHPGDTLREWHHQDVALRTAGFFLTLDTFMISGGLDQNNFAHHNMAARYDFAKEGVVNHVSTNWNKLTSGQSDLMGQGLYHFGWDAAALWSGRGVVTGAAELAYRGAVDLAVASKPVLGYRWMAAKRVPVVNAKYSALNISVDREVKALQEISKAVEQKIKLNEKITNKNIVWRALTEDDLASIKQGQGILAKAPGGTWTAAEHVANEGPTTGGANLNSPWISTTRNEGIAQAYNSGAGYAQIDLGQIQSPYVEVWKHVQRSNGKVGLAYHRSIWSEEVTVFEKIPPSAIMRVNQ